MLIPLKVQPKIITVLLGLSKRYKRIGQNPDHFKKVLNQIEFASYLSITPETLSRELTKLEELNLLKVSHGLVTIINRQGLEALITNPQSTLNFQS
jgi:CRP/FNR family transcriptional regulator